MKRKKILYAVLPAVFAAAAWQADLMANARNFSYTYESAVLPAGEREIEIWHTEVVGRDRYYHGIDQRLEFEWGIMNNLQGSVYFNFSSVQAADETGTYQKENKLYGTSLELKYRLLERSVSPFGLALYGEVLSMPNQTEAEAKLILDKKMGPLLLAINLVGEREWVYKRGKNETENTFTSYAAISYRPASAFSLGLEFSSVHEIKNGDEFETRAIYAGPVFSYDGGNWWFAMTILPKWKEMKEGEGSEVNDKFNARLLFGFHF